jgi:hypothetical protein
MGDTGDLLLGRTAIALMLGLILFYGLYSHGAPADTAPDLFGSTARLCYEPVVEVYGQMRKGTYVTGFVGVTSHTSPLARNFGAQPLM